MINDVEVSPGPKALLFDKHVEYIANHGNDQNDYVSSMTMHVYFCVSVDSSILSSHCSSQFHHFSLFDRQILFISSFFSLILHGLYHNNKLLIIAEC